MTCKRRRTALNPAKGVALVLLCLLDTTWGATKFQKWRTPSFFRGFNVSYWSCLYDDVLTLSDIIALRDAGANLAIIQTRGLVQDTFPYAPEDPWYIEALDSMVSYCRQAGVYYVICPRTGPGRRDVWEEGEGLVPRSTIWTNPTEQQLYADMLKQIASRYLPDSLFVGLDLIQEPNPFDEDAACLPPETLEAMLAESGIDVNALMAMCIESVRTVAPQLPLLVQGVHWSDPGYFSLVQLQDDSLIVYNTHSYNPYEYSHAEPAMSVSYPDHFWGCAFDWEIYWCADFIRDTLFSAVRNLQTTYNVPIILGECGLRYPQNGGERYIADMVGAALSFGWHFALWAFRADSTFNYELMGPTYWSTVCSLLTCDTTALVGEAPKHPWELSVAPNPFSRLCRIVAPPEAQIDVVSVDGRIVAHPKDGLWRPEKHLPPGVYIVTARLGERRKTQKVLLVR